MPSSGFPRKDFASWDDLWDIQQQFRALKDSCESQTYEINCANTQVSMLIKKVHDLENKNEELMSANDAHQSNIEDLVDTASSLTVRLSVIESRLAPRVPSHGLGSSCNKLELLDAENVIGVVSRIAALEASSAKTQMQEIDHAGFHDRILCCEAFVGKNKNLDSAYLTNCANDTRSSFKILAEHVDKLEEDIASLDNPMETKMEQNEKRIFELSKDLGSVKKEFANFSTAARASMKKEKKRRGSMISKYNSSLLYCKNEIDYLKKVPFFDSLKEATDTKPLNNHGDSPLSLSSANFAGLRGLKRSLDDEL